MNLLRRASWFFGKGYSRKHFEKLYSGTARDAWRYEQGEFTRLRFDMLAEMLPQASIGAVLEVGCAEGHFTRILALRAKQVVACDISELAIQRSKQNCLGLRNVQFIRADVRKGLPIGFFDLILCSDVLYYLSKKEAVHVLESFARSLRPGAFLLFSNEWQANYRCLLNPQEAFGLISHAGVWKKLRSEEIKYDDQRVLSVGLFRKN
jgi:SAM-dependent methyltransferase